MVQGFLEKTQLTQQSTSHDIRVVLTWMAVSLDPPQPVTE